MINQAITDYEALCSLQNYNLLALVKVPVRCTFEIKCQIDRGFTRGFSQFYNGSEYEL